MSKINFQTPLFGQFSELQLWVIHKFDAFYKSFEYVNANNDLNSNSNAHGLLKNFDELIGL